MKIVDAIALFEKEGSWVSWENQTRDHVLYGDAQQEVSSIGVCWVATKQAIEEAIQKGSNFIITHENPFYCTSTRPKTLIHKAIEEKKQLLDKGNICIYRCHDVWDSIREYGVSDQWAKRLGFTFEPRIQNSYYQYANILPQRVCDLAQHVASSLLEDGENGIYVFGDVHKEVHRLAIGTGAATDIFEMLKEKPDAMIVSDDGITNYCEAQYAIDYHVPLLVVHHASCEIAGLKAMVPYLIKHFPTISCTYLEEGYNIHHFLAK
ncbi:MAG: Nif3-like dinuclear metal center hexameric protein [Longicatena sp.]